MAVRVVGLTARVEVYTEILADDLALDLWDDHHSGFHDGVLTLSTINECAQRRKTLFGP